MFTKIRAWQKSAVKKLLHNRVFTVQSHIGSEGNKSGVFYTISTKDWINIIARTPSSEIILVCQYRHGIDKITLEIPGGVIDTGETPLEAAKRELLEETGFESQNWIPLGKAAANSALMDNYSHFFFADQCERVSGQNLDELEDIEVVILPESQFLEKIEDGEIEHSLVLAAVSRWLLWKRSYEEG